MRGTLAALGLGLFLVTLVGCPSSRGAVEAAVEAGFRCDPAQPSDGQCPDGAVCGLEGTCHARVSGAWVCDAAQNAADGTNPRCFGEPADVCGADGRCHAETDAEQGWACREDAQCRNGRRCSEASWTCVETGAEALLPSTLPPLGAVEVLPSILGGAGASVRLAASAVSGACTSSDRDGNLSLHLPGNCPEGTLANRIQAFARIDGERVQTWVLGQSPLGGDPRTWLQAGGLHAFPDVTLDPLVREELLGVALVTGSIPYIGGSTNTGVFPVLAWVEEGGVLHLRATPTFTASVAWSQSLFSGPPPVEAGLKLFSKPAHVAAGTHMAQALIHTHADVRRVVWGALDAAVPPAQVFAATAEMGAIEDVAPLPHAEGIVVVTASGTYHRFVGSDPDWHPGQSLTSLPDLEPERQARLNALLAGPRDLRLLATSDAAQLMMTVRATDPAGDGSLMVLPSTDLSSCGEGAPLPYDSRVCFRVACEPCATAKGERAEAIGWVPGGEGEPASFLVRCHASSGMRTVSVRAQRTGDSSALACRVDARTDSLGRDARSLTPISSANAAAFRDAHNILSALPLGDGSAELVASGLDRAPHGVVRLNGKLAAFTAQRTWRRELEPTGEAVGAFTHAPLAGMAILGTVHAPPTFTRTLLLASVQGEASVMDVTEPSLDMFPVAAVFQRAVEATDAPHHSVVVQTQPTISPDGAQAPPAFTLFTTVDDSLLGADVSTMASGSAQGSMAELTVRATPQPGSEVRSVAFTEPVDDTGAPLFARGFLLTDNGLFGFEAVSPKRFRSFELPSRENAWVGLFTEGTPMAEAAVPARARLAYRDGVIVSLPSQLPLSGTLPTRGADGSGDSLVAVLHHCGHTYGLSERTLFHLSVARDQALGVWEDVLQNADAEARPFAGGSLHRDGTQLYLFGARGHARTWTAPACSGG